MIRRVVAIIAFILGFTVVFGCQTYYPTTKEMAEDKKPVSQVVSVSEEHNGSLVRMREGDSLHVSLEADPSSGYVWRLQKGWDKVLDELSESEFKVNEDNKEKDATLGKRTWMFVASKPGIETLKFLYVNLMDQNKTVKTFRLMIHVKDDTQKDKQHPIMQEGYQKKEEPKEKMEREVMEQKSRLKMDNR